MPIILVPEKFWKLAHLSDEEFKEAEHKIEETLPKLIPEEREKLLVIQEEILHIDASHKEYEHEVEEVFTLIEQNDFASALVLVETVHEHEDKLAEQSEEALFQIEEIIHDLMVIAESKEPAIYMAMTISTIISIGIR